MKKIPGTANCIGSVNQGLKGVKLEKLVYKPIDVLFRNTLAQKP